MTMLTKYYAASAGHIAMQEVGNTCTSILPKTASSVIRTPRDKPSCYKSRTKLKGISNVVTDAIKILNSLESLLILKYCRIPKIKGTKIQFELKTRILTKYTKRRFFYKKLIR